MKVLNQQTVVLSCFWSSVLCVHIHLEVEITPASMEHVCAHALLHMILLPARIFSVLLCRQVTCFVFVVSLKAAFRLH